MARWQPMKAVFYDPDDLSQVKRDTANNGTLYPRRAKYLAGKNEAGEYSVEFPITQYYDDLIQKNVICVLSQTDDVWDTVWGDPLGQNFGPGFIVRDITPSADEAGSFIVVSGPEACDDLKYGQPIFRPIGAEVQTSTTVVGSQTFLKETNLTVGAPSGNNSCTVTSTSGVLAGDTIDVAMDGAYGFHTAIVAVVVGPTQVTFSPALPHDATSGNPVSFRRFASVDLTPLSKTLAVGAPNNNDSCTLNNVTGIYSGNEIRITMDSGRGTHVAKIKEIGGYLGENRLTFTPRIPYDAGAGASVEIRKRVIRIKDNFSAFAKGTEVHVVLNSSPPSHYTRAAEEPVTDEFGVYITLEMGIPSAVSAGNAVNAYDYSNPATDDVEQVMAYRPDWSVSYDDVAYEGTELGSFRAPVGDSVYDLLKSIADSTGEYWRASLDAAAGTFVRRIDWGRTYANAGYGGGRLRLVMSPQASADSDAIDVNRAIITGNVRPTIGGDILTRVYPFAGDDRVSLALATDAAISIATAAGFTVVIPDQDTNLYGYPYIYDAALEANPEVGIRARTQNFSTIRANLPKIPELQAAADELLKSAVIWLQERQDVRTYYDIDGVVSACPIRPGDRVELVYNDPSGAWSITKTVTNSLYVLEVTREYDATSTGESKGVPFYSLRLSDQPWAVPTPQAAEATLARDTDRAGRVAGGSASQISISVGNKSTIEGTGGTSDHGLLTGLGDDDHSQYWNVTRGGAAISSHAAISDAHHSPVTAGNATTSVSGQAISVNTAIAGNGLYFVGDVMHVNVGTLQALEFSGDLLSVKTVGGNAVTKDSSGLYMVAPGTLTAATANSNATAHTHAITAVSSAVSTGSSTLLKSGAFYDLAVRHIAAGTSIDPNSALHVKAYDPTHNSLMVSRQSSQTGDVFRVNNEFGDPLLMVNGEGNLESGLIGFVSGASGWQLTPAGRFECNDAFIRGELHATTFVTDEVNAIGGELLLTTASNVAAPVASSDNMLPVVDSYFVLNVNSSWVSYSNYFPVGSILRCKVMLDDSGIDLYDIYAQVSSVFSDAGTRNMDPTAGQVTPGYFQLYCRLRWTASGSVAGLIVPTGTPVLRWTEVGTGSEGAIKLSASDTYGPFIDVLTVEHQSDTTWGAAPTISTHVRMGQLDGVLGLSSQWGIAMATDMTDTSDDAAYIKSSDTGMLINNVPLDGYEGGNRIYSLDDNGLTFYSGAAFGGTILFKNASLSTIGYVSSAVPTGRHEINWLLQDPPAGGDATYETTVLADGDANFAVSVSGNRDATASSGTMTLTGRSDGATARLTLDGVNLHGDYLYGYQVEVSHVVATTDLVSPLLDLDQGAGDGVVLKASSSDVNHGMYGTAGQNDVYLAVSKIDASEGGTAMSGFSEGIRGFYLRGFGSTADTTNTAAGRAAVNIIGGLKSGTTYGNYGVNDNVLAVLNGGNTVFMVKGDGDFTYDGAGASYDDYDDIKLLRAADMSLASQLDKQWEDWLGYNRADLSAAGIVTYNDDGRHFISGKRLSRLTIGAVWQLHERLEKLENLVGAKNGH